MVSIQFRKKFTGPSFCGGWAKKLLPDISFDSGVQKIVSSSLLLFSCACYLVDLSVISTVVDSYTSHFSNIFQKYCPNI